MLGKIIYTKDVPFYDPNSINIVHEVSNPNPTEYGKGAKKIILVDCGCKNNIIRHFIKRNIRIKMVPCNYDFTKEKFNGLFISNGPGDPTLCDDTIEHIKMTMDMEKPIFGICLGSQLLALAAGASTYKLKFGHRSQNQPCIEIGTKRCYITTQNHGFAVNPKKLPSQWSEWFVNANDGSNEGIMHKSKPFFSVQFHPEHYPGPSDTEFLFDKFVELL